MKFNMDQASLSAFYILVFLPVIFSGSPADPTDLMQGRNRKYQCIFLYFYSGVKIIKYVFWRIDISIMFVI